VCSSENCILYSVSIENLPLLRSLLLRFHTAKIRKKRPQSQTFPPLFYGVAQNGKLRVYTLLTEVVADAHLKRIGNLMQPPHRHVTPTVYPVVHRLAADA
jgi:hypothetical protein